MKANERRPLQPDEITAALAELPGWSGDEHGLKKEITFAGFREALRYMEACADGIEQRDHHPVWCNKYKSLDIHLDTFDAGHRVTRKDVELAKFLEGVLRGTY